MCQPLETIEWGTYALKRTFLHTNWGSHLLPMSALEESDNNHLATLDCTIESLEKSFSILNSCSQLIMRAKMTVISTQYHINSNIYEVYNNAFDGVEPDGRIHCGKRNPHQKTSPRRDNVSRIMCQGNC